MDQISIGAKWEIKFHQGKCVDQISMRAELEIFLSREILWIRSSLELHWKQIFIKGRFRGYVAFNLNVGLKFIER